MEGLSATDEKSSPNPSPIQTPSTLNNAESNKSKLGMGKSKIKATVPEKGISAIVFTYLCLMFLLDILFVLID